VSKVKFEPSKIVCVGLNYRDHAAELKMPTPEYPIIFLKPPTALIGHDQAIIYPKKETEELHYEAELAMIVKKEAHRIGEKEAAKYILGFTCANDVTARDLQRADGQWTRAKSFDTFCPVGPTIVSGIDPNDLAIKLYLNGKIKQDSRTSQMVFRPAFLISFISRIMTLLPGDIILTGTPAGVGPMEVGDVVEVEIEEIGRLKNGVVAGRGPG